MSFERTLKIKNTYREFCYFCNKKVPKWKNSAFCSNKCHYNYKIKSSIAFLRKETFKRDKGICNMCNCDTKKIRRILNKVFKGLNEQIIKEEFKDILKHFGIYSKPYRTLFEADHILPVHKGGGECDLNNIQTLCISCHKIKTKEDLQV